jgi:hypothetical protein
MNSIQKEAITIFNETAEILQQLNLTSNNYHDPNEQQSDTVSNRDLDFMLEEVESKYLRSNNLFSFSFS